MDPHAYRALLACDIAGSAGRGEARLQHIRQALRSALAASFTTAGLDLAACPRTDTGDGWLIAAPAGAAKATLLHPLLTDLAQRLRRYNRVASPGTELTLRVALHAGEIRLDSDGSPSGAAFEAPARLLESDALRQAVRAGTAGTPVAAILSRHFYEETVAHGYEGLDADAFTRVEVRVKQYEATGWLWYPGSPIGPRPDPAPEAEPYPAPPTPAPTPAPRASSSTEPTSGPRQDNRASDSATLFAVQNGTLVHVAGESGAGRG